MSQFIHNYLLCEITLNVLCNNISLMNFQQAKNNIYIVENTLSQFIMHTCIYKPAIQRNNSGLFCGSIRQDKNRQCNLFTTTSIHPSILTSTFPI